MEGRHSRESGNPEIVVHEINIDEKLKSCFNVIVRARNNIKYFSKLSETVPLVVSEITDWDIISGDFLRHPIVAPLTDQHNYLTDEFQVWVLRRLVRDIIEEFYILLDKIYSFCWAFEKMQNGSINSSDFITEV